MPSFSPWRFCVAPMLDWTTYPCRELHRILNPKARLYTEMVSTGALIFGDRQRFLHHEGGALQLGGGDAEELARATALAQEYGYEEINLNVGCPSARVQNNRIGACLMAQSKLCAQLLSSMQRESQVPVTIKHRLGIDEQDEKGVFDFVDCIAQESPCRIFIVHARKAWLEGLSPKENRERPPLRYELVYELKQRFPELTIVLNGGITSIAAAGEHLRFVDGVMLGRAAYQNPELLNDAVALWGETAPELTTILPQLRARIARALAEDEPLSHWTRHLLGLFPGRAGARKFRQLLSESARAEGAGLEVWDAALAAVGYENASIML